MTIAALTDAIATELSRSGAAMAGVLVMLASATGRAHRARKAPHRIDTLHRRTLRDIGYTRHGISEAALAARNEVGRE